jgi:hypothetical protein
MPDFKDIERRLLHGESVTTRELNEARKLYGRIREDTLSLGPHWHFAFKEANRLEMMCRDYLRARQS